MTSNSDNVYPRQIEDNNRLTEESQQYYKYHLPFIRVGEKGYLLYEEFKKDAANIYNMPIRTTDVFVVSFPRTGTTWTQELVWLVANDLDYKTAAEKIMPQRYPFLELFMFFPDEMKTILRNECNGNAQALMRTEFLVNPVTERIKSIPSPRFLKTHLPLSLLPPSLLDTAKVVYVARDPRDVAVSYYYHLQKMRTVQFSSDLKSFWELFINDKVLRAPFFEHLKEAWEKRHHPNMLFIFYEDLIKDLGASVRRVAKFFDKQLTDEEVADLCEHLSFGKLKQNDAVNIDKMGHKGLSVKGGEPFLRKGKAGGWRESFDEEMTAQAERWMEDNLRGTDLRFPAV